MKQTVFNLQGEKLKEINLPRQFNEGYHPDLIKRAFLAIRANKRQAYGADPEAGQKVSAKLSRRRRDYKGSYGHGMSRVPRKTMWKRGTQFGWVGAEAPGTVGGRRAHPPKSEKIWEQKINIKERRKAIRSALAATLNEELIKARGHLIPKNHPIIIDSTLESLQKTKETKQVLEKLGFKDELKRSSIKKVRAGIGKMRGRKYKKKVGPLIIVSGNCSLLKTGRNIAGVDIADIKNVNTELLAPGAIAGRLTLFTEKAINKLEKENLFANSRKVKK